MPRNFRSNWFSGIVYLGVAGIAGFASSMAVLTYLPAADSGLFLLCQAQMAFVVLFDFGLLLTSSREFAFAVGRGSVSIDKAAAKKDLSYIFLLYRDARLFALLFLISLGGLLLVALWLFPIVRASANGVSLALAIAGGTVVLMTYLHQSVLEGGGFYYFDRYISAATTAASMVFIVGAAYFGGRAVYVLAAWYLGYLLSLVAKGIAAYRIFPNLHFWGIPRIANLRSALNKSYSIALLQLGAVTTKYLQYPIVAHFMDVKVLGGYFFVTRITTTIDQAIAVVAVSQRAIFSRAIGAGNYLEARRIMLQVGAQVLLGSCAAGAFVIFGLPPLLKAIVSSNDVSQVPFIIIGLDLIAMCLSGSMTQIVIASGRNPFHKVVAITAVITIVLLILLVPRYGLLGAAVSQAIGGAVTNLWFSAWQFLLTMHSLKGQATRNADCQQLSENR